jgi:hypothetical protein
MPQTASLVPRFGDLDLVGTEHAIVASVVHQHWGLVEPVANYDPETAELTLRRLQHNEGRAGDLKALVLRYVLSRHAAGLPVIPPSPA